MEPHVAGPVFPCTLQLLKPMCHGHFDHQDALRGHSFIQVLQCLCLVRRMQFQKARKEPQSNIDLSLGHVGTGNALFPNSEPLVLISESLANILTACSARFNNDNFSHLALGPPEQILNDTPITATNFKHSLIAPSQSELNGFLLKIVV